MISIKLHVFTEKNCEISSKNGVFRQFGRTEPRVKLAKRSAEHVRSVSAERLAEPFGFGRTLVGFLDKRKLWFGSNAGNVPYLQSILTFSWSMGVVSKPEKGHWNFYKKPIDSMSLWKSFVYMEISFKICWYYRLQM